MGKHPKATPKPAFRSPPPALPRSDVFEAPSPARRLPVRTAALAGKGLRPGWFFLAAHGGSGAKLLARMSWQPYKDVLQAAVSEGRPVGDYPAYGIPAGRAWPNPRLESTRLVVVVCRTTMAGLAWARDVAAQYLAGQAPTDLEVLGVVTVADQPGRLPRPLESSRALLKGVYGASWHVPFVPEYRLYGGLPDEQCPEIHPAVAHVLAEIRSTLSKGQS